MGAPAAPPRGAGVVGRLGRIPSILGGFRRGASKGPLVVKGGGGGFSGKKTPMGRGPVVGARASSVPTRWRVPSGFLALLLASIVFNLFKKKNR